MKRGERERERISKLFTLSDVRQRAPRASVAGAVGCRRFVGHQDVVAVVVVGILVGHDTVAVVVVVVVVPADVVVPAGSAALHS